MKVRWLSQALMELDRVHEYLAAKNPNAAGEVFRTIHHATERLSRFPQAGRAGHVPGTREWVIPGLPYLIVYRVAADSVEILRVFHTARNWAELLQ